MLDRLKILIVDDSPHMINITRTLLRAFGAKELHEATSAAEAFAQVKTTPFDLIITDYAMAPVDGCAFTKTLRTAQGSPNPFIPVIMLTAYAEKSIVEAARDAGVTEFCAKPITATDLYRKICAVINSPRPFVRTSVYFGPDRRRRVDDAYKGEERRENMFAAKKPADPVA